MREKLYGIWNAISWNQWLERSRAVTFALHEIGFRPGDVASVLANTVPEWNYADFGILCAGGVSSGIYPTDSAKQLEYLVNDSHDLGPVRRGRRAARQGARRARAAARPCARSSCSTWRACAPSTIRWWSRSTSSWRRAATTARARTRCSRSWSPRASPTTSPSWSTRRARPGRPRAPCTAIATSSTRCRTACIPSSRCPGTRATSGWPSCRSAMSPSVSPAATTRSRPASAATSPRAPRRCRTISARCSPPCSAPCRASGRSSTPAS